MNPDNRDFIIREAEKIIAEYIKDSKANASIRRQRMLRREQMRKKLVDLTINVCLVLSFALLVFLLFQLF